MPMEGAADQAIAARSGLNGGLVARGAARSALDALLRGARCIAWFDGRVAYDESPSAASLGLSIANCAGRGAEKRR